MCDCSEERERQARARARRDEALLRRMMGGGNDDDDDDGELPPPRFSCLQIALGSFGFILASIALILKTVDRDTLHAILSKVGLGHLIPKTIKDGCLDEKRQKWPKPPPPPCPPRRTAPKKC